FEFTTPLGHTTVTEPATHGPRFHPTGERVDGPATNSGSGPAENSGSGPAENSGSGPADGEAPTGSAGQDRDADHDGSDDQPPF
ncbi:hypothetical protein C7K25_08255, partial [Gulosibacter molinativorax]|nr:hypothetical protein [Gulosibacter molinativorax]